MSHRVLRLVFDTQENLQNEQLGKLTSMVEEYGWLVFLPGDKMIDAKDLMSIPPIPEKEQRKKSPSQRLRDCMARFYEATINKDFDGFDTWYADQLEKMSQKYLERINK